MSNQETINTIIERARAGDFLAFGLGHGFKAKGVAADIIRNEPALADAYRAMLFKDSCITLDTRKFLKFLGSDENRTTFLHAVDESMMNVAQKLLPLGVYNHRLIHKLVHSLTAMRNAWINSMCK